MGEFIEAIKRGDLSAAERMLDADPSVARSRDEKGTSALLLCYYYGRAEVARALLERKPDLTLSEAAAVGDAARIRALRPDRATVNAFAGDGFFPLGLAAFFKRPEAVAALLELGADVRLASRPAGFTPLHSAVADDGGTAVQEIVHALLDAGADPNARSASGGTPLHTAAFTGNVSVMRMLLAAGGDPTVADKKGQTPLDIARERNHGQTAAALHEAVMARGR